MTRMYQKPLLRILALAAVLLVMLLMNAFMAGAAFAKSSPPKHRVHALTIVGVGNQPDSVAIGDFNGDGNADMAVANAADNTVSVLLGRGDGTFAPAVTYAVGHSPKAVAVGDFNGDGKLDLVTANFSDNTVSVLLGKGDGTFSSQSTYTVGSFPTSVAVGDFNRDGKLDLAVANSNDSTIGILPGNGDGTFAPQVTYPVGNFPLSVAVGDFNRDGKLDLVTTNASGNTVSVLLGNGDGSFAAPVAYSVGSGARSVAVGDFNRDGKLDLVAANSGDSTISFLAGNGDGTFAPQVTYPVSNASSVAVASDLNGDGKLDLVTVNSNANSVSVLLGNGDGTFAPPVSYSVGQNPFAVAIGDLNNDGKLDMAVVNETDNTVSILLGNGDGTFTSYTMRVTPQNISETAGVPFTIAVANVTGVQQASDLTVVINWNDDTPTSVGTVSGTDPYTITGSHTYSKAGTYAIHINVTDSNTNQTIMVSPTATVVASNVISLTGQNVSATEGSPFNSVVATGTENGGSGQLSAFVTWGDGSSSIGNIISTGPNTFSVNAPHTYTDEGNYTIGVTVIDSDGLSGSTSSPATVSDAALTLKSFSAGSNALVATLKATITDGNTDGQVMDFTATINWGDGTTQPITIAKGKLPYTYSMTGTHTYAKAGTYTVTLTVTDDGGSQLTKTVPLKIK